MTLAASLGLALATLLIFAYGAAQRIRLRLLTERIAHARAVLADIERELPGHWVAFDETRLRFSVFKDSSCRPSSEAMAAEARRIFSATPDVLVTIGMITEKTEQMTVAWSGRSPETLGVWVDTRSTLMFTRPCTVVLVVTRRRLVSSAPRTLKPAELSALETEP